MSATEKDLAGQDTSSLDAINNGDGQDATWLSNDTDPERAGIPLEEIAIVVGELIPKKYIGPTQFLNQNAATEASTNPTNDSNLKFNYVLPTKSHTKIVVWKFAGEKPQFAVLRGNVGDVHLAQKLSQREYDQIAFYMEWTKISKKPDLGKERRFKDWCERLSITEGLARKRAEEVETNPTGAKKKASRMQKQERKQEYRTPTETTISKGNQLQDMPRMNLIEQINRVLRSLSFFDDTKNDIFLQQASDNIKLILGELPEEGDETLVFSFVNNRTDKVYFEEAQEVARAIKNLWFKGQQNCPIKFKAEYLFLMAFGLRNLDAPTVIEMRYLRSFVIDFCILAETNGVNIPVYDNVQLSDADRGKLAVMIQTAFSYTLSRLGNSPPIPSADDVTVFTRPAGGILYVLI
ncbi:uncharacterized protein F4812DRAFT_456998 [Daldinia caldariorum]|uniref:uncharacterized protein n=1 Tax=Daldinia caldariorum TaxID=326644 RepID=UPI0020077F01|nr:uncharacterized protein F4812DRAFT_456998 [Daldinia caldariorum]KAI1469598.1 hypothetical protein F4812DRAFT_456998 [Daldinia caldariorum]